jgi:hypothetical protein
LPNASEISRRSRKKKKSCRKKPKPRLSAARKTLTPPRSPPPSRQSRSDDLTVSIVPDSKGPDAEQAIAATREWLERAVIGLGLCPFAKAVHVKGQIRYAYTDARNSSSLLDDLQRELHTLAEAPPEDIDTTLLIHPFALNDFLDYNDFLQTADELVEAEGFAGTLQVASFHPRYQFAGTSADDITNYTNRSPYPTLHLLREASVDAAVAAFPEAEAIFEKNIETMERLGLPGWESLGLRPGRR